jgi:hypothetical protein
MMRASTILTGEPTRRVFFSFHYQRDIWRVQQVRHHWVTKDTHAAAGYFDGSLEEKAQTEGDAAVKRLVNRGLFGSSVTCVLIGTETINRRWVHYEIFKSIEAGMGILGVRIHQLNDRWGHSDQIGANPFECLALDTIAGSNNVRPAVNYTQGGWKRFELCEDISRAAAPYLPSIGVARLQTIFRVYDWVNDSGYGNFASWVKSAANQAGR